MPAPSSLPGASVHGAAPRRRRTTPNVPDSTRGHGGALRLGTYRQFTQLRAAFVRVAQDSTLTRVDALWHTTPVVLLRMPLPASHPCRVLFSRTAVVVVLHDRLTRPDSRDHMASALDYVLDHMVHA